jgi:hypothetical protein
MMPLLGLFIAMFTFAAFGQDFPVPDVDPFTALFELIKNWKTLSPLAIGMTSIVVIIQVLKRFLTNFKYGRLAVTVLSVAYAVLLKMSEGISTLDAAISVIIVGGGAVAIYEAFKGIKSLILGEESIEPK